MFALVIASLSLSSLGFAYYVEYVLNIKPCILCIYQRIPYYLLLATSIVHYFLIRTSASRSFIIYAYIILFLSSASLSSYHVLVERDFITHETCSAMEANPGASIEDIKKQIYQSKPSCNQVSFSILGASMAELNVVFSLFATLLVVRYRKKI